MKPWLVLIGVAILTMATASVAVPLLTESSSPGQLNKKLISAPTEISADAPQVEVAGSLNHDFGIMAQDTTGTNGWLFKNTGKGTLELRNLGTDCSCTIAQIGKSGDDSKSGSGDKTMLPVAPGAQERVELTWNTRMGTGGYHKSARIGTNDPRQPEVVLSVEGKVYPAVSVDPERLVVGFQTVSNDEDAHRAVAIYSKNKPDLKIIRLVSSNEELIQAKSRAMNSEELAYYKVDAGLMVEITLKPTAKLGNIAEEVLAQIDHPDKPEVRLKVTGRITGPISLIPDRAEIRDATASDGGATDLIVWVRGRSGTKISVEKAPPGVEVKLTPIPQPANVSGSKFRMTVRIAPGSAAGQIQDEIALKTDHPQAAQIRVPLDALILDSR